MNQHRRPAFVDVAQANLKFHGADDNIVANQQTAFEAQVNASRTVMKTLANRARDITKKLLVTLQNHDKPKLKRYNHFKVSFIQRKTTEYLADYSVLKREENNFNDPNYPHRVSVLAATRLITWNNSLKYRLQFDFKDETAKQFVGIYKNLQHTIEGLQSLFKHTFPKVYSHALHNYTLGAHGADFETDEL